MAILTGLSRSDWGEDFLWGVATAAAQIEGAASTDGRGPSIWDIFAKRAGAIKNGHSPRIACDFYHRYKDDLLLAKALGFKVFRFSISWSRIFPNGTGTPNHNGVLFYHNVIDECLKLEMTPMVTLYHWDLPFALEKQGGWASPLFIKWFRLFTVFCAKEFGKKVTHWIVLNEPAGFTTLGYMLGRHAPGKKGLANFLPAIQNAALAQAEGSRILRYHAHNACIGISYSCSRISPYTDTDKDRNAAEKIDTLLNRLFIEPALGMGFPESNFPLMEKIYFHCNGWRHRKKYQADFDFIGIQNYFPVTVRHNPLIPYIQASEVKARARKVPLTSLGWEINASSFYDVLKRFAAYESEKDIIVTENGACFKDIFRNGSIQDTERVAYFQEYLKALLKARQEGIPVKGYLVWTLTDNFEWAEGYNARFGLIYIDFKSQLRTIKASGHWWREFLTSR